MSNHFSLGQMGWSVFFQQQLSLEEWDNYFPARVVARHRSTLDLIAEGQSFSLPVTDKTHQLTVGDWLLVNKQLEFFRALERLSVFSRKAAGTKIAEQLIAANVDTTFIVCSLNQDFNLNRIERYLALVQESGAEPVVVLTKKDLCKNYQEYLQQVMNLDAMLMVEAVNGLDEDSVEVLKPWYKTGKNIALLGSSGVGKSTLVNALLSGLGHDSVHSQLQKTAAIREDDSKGRHTTTARSLHFTKYGAVLLDTPGMRELQITDCEQGVQKTFADVAELITQCRYSDCQHGNEPGCAIQQAIEQGVLDRRRFESYNKLMREQEHNSASLAEKRAKDRALSKYYRSVQDSSRQMKKGS